MAQFFFLGYRRNPRRSLNDGDGWNCLRLGVDISLNSEVESDFIVFLDSLGAQVRGLRCNFGEVRVVYDGTISNSWIRDLKPPQDEDG